MGHCLWIHNLELAIRYFDDIGSRTTGHTRSPPCSARSYCDCRVSAAPAVVGQRLVSTGLPIAARHLSSTRSGLTCRRSCPIGPPPVCSNTFCRLMPEPIPILRRRTLRVGEHLRDAAPAEPAAPAAAITLSLDFDLHPQL